MRQLAILTFTLFLVVGSFAALAQPKLRTVIIERPGGQKKVFRGLGIRELSTKLGQFFKSSENGKFRILDQATMQKDALRFVKQGDQVEVIKLETGSAEEMYQEYALSYDRGLLTICKSNLKNIATANEMYSTDWSGRYPQNLDQLIPNYLNSIPHCQTDQAPPYSYEVTKRDEKNIDAFELSCHGDHSPVGTVLGYPRYNWLVGILLEPDTTLSEPESELKDLDQEEKLPELKAPQRSGKGDAALLRDLEMAKGMPGYDQAILLEPQASTPESVALGAKLFASDCAACHGEQGKGDGPVGMALDPNPSDLTDASSYHQGRLELGVFRTIYFGIPGTGAAPYGGYLDPIAEIWPLVHYVRSLQDVEN